MLCRKAPTSNQQQIVRKELEHLYHRRYAVEMLIRSLEVYERCQNKGTENGRSRRSA